MPNPVNPVPKLIHSIKESFSRKIRMLNKKVTGNNESCRKLMTDTGMLLYVTLLKYDAKLMDRPMIINDGIVFLDFKI